MKKLSKSVESKFVYAMTDATAIRCKSVADALQRASFNNDIEKIKFFRNNKVCFYIRTGANTWKESSL